MSQSTTPADTVLVPATDPVASEGLFFTVAELRAAMAPVGYMTPADQINAAAAAAAQATANAAIPASSLGQPLGPVQSDATGKVPLANLPASVLGVSHYLGTWNASTNTPLIQSGTAPNVVSPVGAYYIVSVSGTPTIDGVSVWHAGDWIIWNGTDWSDISGQVNPVSSVAGLQGAVSTAQLATALAGTVGLSSSSGQLNVVTGTAAGTVAAGNDSRIVGAAQTPTIYTYLANVAAIATYTGSSPALHTAGYYAAGDGGGACYTQTNTGTPAIVDGAGRNWYLQDVAGTEVNILHFGAKPDGVTDMQPAWAAADAFAQANHKTVFVPSAPSGRSWKLITPMVCTARALRFEAQTTNGLGGTIVHFQPATITDQLTAITLSGDGLMAENVAVSGPDSMPSLATLMTSGWIAATSSFQGTISGTGTTLNVVSGLTGTPAVGNQISGAGMTSVATITAVAGSTLSISPAQPLIATAQTFTTCALPNYSALKAGTVGIAITGKGVLRNCATYNCKIGMLLSNSGGHVEFYSCSPSGLIGTYVYDNSYDFVWQGGGFGGVWAGIAFGTTNIVGGYGGLSGTFFRVQFPLQAAYHIYQFNDSNNAVGVIGVLGNFYGCSFESCNEACIQTLPYSGTFIRLYDCTQQWGSTPLPNTITPAPQQNLFSLGYLTEFYASCNGSNNGASASHRGTWAASSLGGGVYPQYSLTASMLPLPYSDIDIRFLDPNLNINQGGSSGRWIGNYRSVEDAQKADLGVAQDLAYSGNLLENPEQNTNGNGLFGSGGNWRTYGGTIASVLISPYASSDLSALPLSEAVQDALGANPSVIKVVTGPSGGTVALPGSGVAFGTNTAVWMRYWVVQLATPVKMAYSLFTGSNVKLYDNTFTPGPNEYWPVLEVNRTCGSVRDTTGAILETTIGTAGAATFYLLGMMVGKGELSPYNPVGIPIAQNGLAIGSVSTSLASPAAPTITSGAAAPSLVQPNSSLYLREGGVLGSRLYVSNGATWAAVAGV